MAPTLVPRSIRWTFPVTAPLSEKTVYLLPQQPTEPFSKITQEDSPEVTNETARKPVEWLTETGIRVSLVVPSPSCPLTLEPQHMTSPR